MEITKKTLKILFKKYNQLYFNGVLSMCDFSYIKMPSIGRYTYKKEKNNKIKGHIWITNDVEWNEERLKEILIHEMIHHYVVTVNKKMHIDGLRWRGLFGHGSCFKKQCKRIKSEYNIKIEIYPSVYHKNEKIPTTFKEKVLRYIKFKLW